VISMTFMFSYARAFTSDLSAWNVGSVNNMRFMFSYARAFTSDLSAWNVGFATNMVVRVAPIHPAGLATGTASRPFNRRTRACHFRGLWPSPLA